MGLKSRLLKPFARYTSREITTWSQTALRDQDKILKDLTQRAKNTIFGKDHRFEEVASYKDFKARVPIRDYEGLKDYVELVKQGQSDVLWPGKPIYFAKTSGTTSGAKYIPITRDSISNHIVSTRNALFNICYKADILNIFDGRVIFLSGSPILHDTGGIPTGRLSGIVNHRIPAWLKGNQLPTFDTNCIDDWEEKVTKIAEETLNQNMSLISGIPPWVQMYYECLLEKSGKTKVRDLFPNFDLFVYGGVNYEPYRQKMEALSGPIPYTLELYPASEGFIAFQDEIENMGLLLNTRSGIFFEFIPVENFFDDNPPRLSLHDVEAGKDYALIINNNAGLWGYNIGDTVRFVSTDPYRLVVSGRVKHYISAFGEHVIGKEVEEAMKEASSKHGVSIVEFTVAPQVNPPEGGLPYHEWLVEFGEMPDNMGAFLDSLDQAMVRQNIYYKDLIEGKILQPLKVRSLTSGAFRNYMSTIGKLGGQNKVPRLANDRKLADKLTDFMRS